MRKIFDYIIIGLITLIHLSYPSRISAQTPVSDINENIGVAEMDSLINPIEKIIEDGNGKIEILISDELIENILKTPTAQKKIKSSGPHIRPGINKISGYRIQVFADGRNQSTLESRAKARGSAIYARFPKYRGQVYTFSSSPNWYTRVGNFQNQTEANTALDELKRAFPSFANEMRIVRSQIVVIK